MLSDNLLLTVFLLFGKSKCTSLYIQSKNR